MTWYRDLEPCEMFGGGALKAVGWLSREHEFPTGEVSTEFFVALCELLVNPWCPVATAGYHECELCRFSNSSSSTFRDYQISSASCTVVFVPGQGRIFVAPVSITHYIDAHGYRPPDEFCHAVLNCPPMRSVAYLQAILHNGGRHFVQWAKG
jgi:hypothetical protein